ncbi:MAG: hypothetical protein ACTSPI_00195 [Candidatus Heimdallarchaeaceae archaeon]
MERTLTSAEQAWKAYDQWIEMDADSASYKAASPENALVLLGPVRKPGGDKFKDLLPIGLLQNFTIGQNINWQAQQMIGSGRTFFLAGKAPGNGSITRLFTSVSTILGAVYQLVTANEDIQSQFESFESKPYQNDRKIMFSLDTELLKIPIGMACLFRNTVKSFIGGFYVENMVIPNLNIGFAVGQPAIFETVNIIFDRVLPFDEIGDLSKSWDDDQESAFDNVADVS